MSKNKISVSEFETAVLEKEEIVVVVRAPASIRIRL